jgi:hypothetical protein
LPLGGAACSRFLLGLLPTPVLHFALAESHGGIVVEWAGVSMSRRTNHRFAPKRTFATFVVSYTKV